MLWASQWRRNKEVDLYVFANKILEYAMGFVNEHITENDRIQVDFSSFEEFSNGYPIEIYKWTVDRERNMFLFPIYGNSREGYRWLMALVINHEVVLFWIDRRVERDDHGSSIVHYMVSKIRMPDGLQDKHSEIVSFIREALDTLGLSFSRQGVSSVYVDIEQ